MVAQRDSRWITVRSPFNYAWPGRQAVTHFADKDLGEHLVKNEVADFAVGGGYATEGRLNASARSKKSGPRRVRASKKGAPAAKAADTGRRTAVGNQDVPAADRPSDRTALDHDAG
jgi:hypothetical protein